MRNMWRSELRI